MHDKYHSETKVLLLKKYLWVQPKAVFTSCAVPRGIIMKSKKC